MTQGQPQKQTNKNRESGNRGEETFRSGMSDNDDLSDDFDPRQRALPPIRSQIPDSDDEVHRGYGTISTSGSEDYRHLQRQTRMMDSPSEESTSMTGPPHKFNHLQSPSSATQTSAASPMSQKQPFTMGVEVTPRSGQVTDRTMTDLQTERTMETQTEVCARYMY